MSDITPFPEGCLQFNPKQPVVNLPVSKVFSVCSPTCGLNLNFYKMTVFFFWIKLALICLITDFSMQQSDFNNSKVNNVLFEKQGNVSILGIFNYRFDNGCEYESEKVLEEITSAIWTVETLNKYQYLPGVTIGLSILGVCQNLINQKDLFQMVESSDFKKDNNSYIGALTTPEFYKLLSTSESFSNKNIVHLEHIISTDMLVDAIVQLLINLQWMSVNTVVSDSAKTLKLFREKASDEGINIQDELLMNGRRPCIKPSGSEASFIVIVIAAFYNIAKLEKIQDESIRLILTPTNFVFDITFLDLPKNTIVLLPAMENKPMLSNYIKSVLRHKDVFNYKPPARGPLFVGTAASILKLLKPMKEVLENRCRNADSNSRRLCASTIDSVIEILGNKSNLVSQKSMKILPADVEETLKVLRIEPYSNEEMFLCISFVLNDNETDDFAIFQMFSLKTKKFQPVLIMVNDNLLRSRGMLTGSEYLDQTFNFTKMQKPSLSKNPVFNYLNHLTAFGEHFENFTFSKNSVKKDCDSDGVKGKMCLNAVMNYTATTQNNNITENNPEVTWRFVTWVFINTSLAFVGVTCTLSTMFFVIIRLCRDDILEGSPYFTLLLMISVIFMYFSSLPFNMEFFNDNGFICGYRENGPSVAFAVLFSLLLSRSIVLAFSDNAKEYNGYVQSILCFFMIGVQISIIVQKYFSEKENYGLNCPDIYDIYKLILPLGYDFLLIFLLACVGPFIVRLRENYKEGLLLSISVFFITVVWSSWVSFYVLLPNEYKDAAVAIGLNSTASVLLFCIFIPQTYLMAAPFVQDSTLRSLSNLDRHILTDSSNFNFKSSQALNENAFGTISYTNCEMGLSNPNFLKIRSNENRNPVITDNFAEETVIGASPDDSSN